MKIALLAPHYPPEFTGGTEAVVRAQARELARLGHDVRIVSGSDRPHAGDDVVRAEVDGLSVAWLPRTADETYDLELDRPRLMLRVREETSGADVVHVHHWSTFALGLVRDLARDGPVVVTLHDHFASCPRFFRTSPIENLACPPRGQHEACARCIAAHAPGVGPDVLQRALAARHSALESEIAAASLVIVPSRAHLEQLRQSLRLPEERVRVLRHGLCPQLTRKARTLPVFDGSRPLVVLHFGHRSRAKGTLDLVEALSRCSRGSTELHLAGREVEPGLDSALREAAHGLRIFSAGEYREEGLSDIAARADIAAFPSRLHESYSLVVEEALALGLPAWVADRGAAAEIVAPRRAGFSAPGLMLPAANPAAWTAAFRQALAFPMMLAAQREAIPARQRTAADAARELEAHYESLLAKTRPTPS